MKIKKLLPAVLAALLSLTVIISPFRIHADEDDPKPTSIRRLNYSKKTLRVGQKFELEAYARPSDYDDDQLIWSTSNKKVATVNSHGYVYGKRTGKATITIQCKADPKIKTKVYVHVERDDDDDYDD